MRTVQGISSVIAYLESVDYPVTEEDIQALLADMDVSSDNRASHFNLDHVDWWINQQQYLEL
ncbi:hypothetical protein AB1K83_12195 [Sporosarcina sp. 179-K 3D1 HS]|uniref:hypothetical protein n=1 Tax=Sporosarcina sp. 179-K 3D1 HS TaxID=3232169 RepID=UPI0039A2B5FA